MDLKELVTRNDAYPLSEKEALYVIEQYILAKKGVNIKAYIETRKGVFRSSEEYQLMFQALSVAISYFRTEFNK